MNEKEKSKVYILGISFFTIIISILITCILSKNIKNAWINILTFIILLIPISELVIQITQYILGKIVKPKLIPKLDLLNGINKENSTMVVIPTILNSKEKVQELMKKLEIYYLANKSENIYFTLLGDCTESEKEEEEFDEEIIKEGIKQVQNLNEKYKSDKEEMSIFNFIYRNRTWNEKEGAYLGWERKRGMLTQFNEYLLGNIEDPFRTNTISHNFTDDFSDDFPGDFPNRGRVSKCEKFPL